MSEMMRVEPMAYGRSHWHWVLGDPTGSGYRLRACQGTEFELSGLYGRTLDDLDGLRPCETCEPWGVERELPGHDALMERLRDAGTRILVLQQQVAAVANELDYRVEGTAPPPGTLSCGRCGKELGVLDPFGVLRESFGEGHRCEPVPDNA